MSRIFKRTKEGMAYLDRYDCDGCSSKISVDGGVNSLPETWYDDERRSKIYCEDCFAERYSSCEKCGFVDVIQNMDREEMGDILCLQCKNVLNDEEA